MKQGQRATYESDPRERLAWRKIFWENWFLGRKPQKGTQERAIYDDCENKLLTERYANKKRIN